MISQGQFNRAMQEINESYSRLVKLLNNMEERLEELKKRQDEADRPAKKSPAKKKDS